MANNMQSVGWQALSDTLKNRGDIAGLINGMFATKTPATTDIVAGSITCLLTIYVAVRDAGHTLRFKDADLDEFMQSPGSVMAAAITLRSGRRDGGAWLSSRLSAITHVVNLHREKMTFNEPVATAAAVPEPLTVRVVGMPDRVTETNVTYDAKGNIASTSQTERDAT